MQQCLIYDDSLKFSRATYGLLVLIAILFRSHWLVLAVIFLMILGIFSLKLNFPYQLHSLFLGKFLKRKYAPMQKELRGDGLLGRYINRYNIYHNLKL